MSKNVVGPGANIQSDVAPKPMLETSHEMEYVTVYNPLDVDFQVMVAQDVPVNLPFEIRKDNSGKTSFITATEQDARQVYGLNLKNNDHQAKRYIHNTTIIPSQETRNFRGNEAQVVVRQLVNEILQRRKQSRFLADPHVRNQVEQEVIKHRGPVQELMQNNIQSPQSQVLNAIDESNESFTNAYPDKPTRTRRRTNS